MLKSRFGNRLTSLIRRFRIDSRGNVAVIFVIALLPILEAVGCAVDYSLATRMRAKLQASADAASVASISEKAPGYTAAALMMEMARLLSASPMRKTSLMET